MMNKIEYKNIGETVFCGELPNGLQVYVIPKPGFQSFYAIYGTKYGGAMRRFSLDGQMHDTPAGVAHFLEHKMFDLPGGDNALNILSANGADPNAFTSSGATCYYFRCTSGFEENLRMLLHFVSTPYFTEETVQKEQGIIGQEIRMGDDSPGSEIYYNLLSLLYDHHPIKIKSPVLSAALPKSPLRRFMTATRFSILRPTWCSVWKETWTPKRFFR